MRSRGLLVNRVGRALHVSSFSFVSRGFVSVIVGARAVTLPNISSFSSFSRHFCSASAINYVNAVNSDGHGYVAWLSHYCHIKIMCCAIFIFVFNVRGYCFCYIGWLCSCFCFVTAIVSVCLRCLVTVAQFCCQILLVFVFFFLFFSLNIPLNIYDKVGTNLHLRAFHPLNIIKHRIQAYFDSTYRDENGQTVFKCFDNIHVN